MADSERASGGGRRVKRKVEAYQTSAGGVRKKRDGKWEARTPDGEVAKEVFDSSDEAIKFLRGKARQTKGIFDAHCSLMDIFGRMLPLSEIRKEMKKCGVKSAVLHVNQYRKVHGEAEKSRPTKHNDDQYPVLAIHRDTDLSQVLDAAESSVSTLSKDKLILSAAGFDFTCRTNTHQQKEILESKQFKAIGPLIFRGADVLNNMLVQPYIQSYITTDFFENIPPGIPIIIRQNSTSVSTKPYAAGFEYIEEFDAFLSKFTENPFIWVNAGVYDRGTWENYDKVLKQMLQKHGHLFCSITPENLENIEKTPWLKKFIQEFPDRFCVGTSGIGTVLPSAYGKHVKNLREFCQNNKQILYDTAAKLFSGDPGKFECSSWVRVNSLVPKMLRQLSVRSQAGVELEIKEPLPEAPYTIIDTHLHLLDFLQKSSGTQTALKAMDDCGVSKAVFFGMPCCKKWSVTDVFAPLYYQDNNADCYFYSYADQMMADAWLALDGDQRKRVAPMIASFNPTDKHAISHVERIYEKYPKMWRGIGEVMCRHDDLTSLLQDKECPTPNHSAMDAIYEFCIEKDLPILIHHNADKVNDEDITYAYVHEVKEVLEKFPTLKFVWVHCGVSRRVHEENHHEMIDQLMSEHKNLRVDISWVVWEEVICENGVPKQVWIDLIQKHNERVMIGSDQVGQFINTTGENLLKGEIVKYYVLLDKLSPEAAKNVAWRNAENLYFKDWEMPELPKQSPVYCVECLDAKQGCFIQNGSKF